jgi:hypothetical protein
MTQFQQVPQTSTSDDVAAQSAASVSRSRIRTIALWVTIGVLIAGALLGGVFIIVGGQSAVIGRAFLTLLLVGLFAVGVLIDGAAPDGPNQRWYLPVSTLLNVLLLVIGLIKVWNGPLQPADTADGGVWFAQISRWFGLVAIVRIALLVTQLYVPAFVVRAKSSVTRLAGHITVALIWLTALVYVIPLSFPNLTPIGIHGGYADWWWRISGATALVAAVCVVIPLVVRAFEPKPLRPVPGVTRGYGYEQAPVYGQTAAPADAQAQYAEQYAQYLQAQAEYERAQAQYEQARAQQTQQTLGFPPSQAPEPPQ